MNAAEDAVASLHAVPDHSAAAVGARRGQRVDGALEAIEDMCRALDSYLERFVVVVSANFTDRHCVPSPFVGVTAPGLWACLKDTSCKPLWLLGLYLCENSTWKGISLLTARAYGPRVSFEAPLTRPRSPRKLLRAVVARLLGGSCKAGRETTRSEGRVQLSRETFVQFRKLSIQSRTSGMSMRWEYPTPVQFQFVT
jgi:hypothetical protein